MNALPRPVRPLNRSVAIAALALAIAGCKTNKENAQAPPAAQAGVATAAITQNSWAPDALEELVAPIALYPDPLVGQILAASVNTQEVLDAGNWLLENQELEGVALDAATENLGFGPATRALLHFPTVVDMMCQELDWTKQLGAAFTSDQKGVLEAIQRLRMSALEVGNLKTGPQQTIETTTQNGQSVVEIKPTDPKIVYVPQYDPAVVYTTPPAASTTVVQNDDDDDALLGALLGFGIGIAVGAAISDNYYYPSWGYGAVYMGPRPFYPPAYVYRPVYSPAFHPAYGYRPPANYVNHYHRGNTNVVINNNNYFNRFDHNSNLKGRTDSPLGGNRGGDRAAASDRARGKDHAGADVSNRQGQSWKGKSGYAGAKAGGSKQVRDAQAKAASKRTDRGYGGSDRATQVSTPRASAGASDRSTTQRASAASAERGGDGAARVASGRGGTRVESGSGADVIRSSGASSRGDNAFSGAERSGSGSFDRAASARGRASTAGSSVSQRSGGGGGGGGRRR